MAAIQFGNVNNRFILKNCFDELRQNREQMKYITLDIAVKEDVDVAIRDTKQYNMDRESSFLVKNQLRASFIVRAMMGKKLFAFFLKWKKETDHMRVTCKTKVYDRLMKIYRNYQFIYFQKWKDQNNLAVMQKRSKIVYDIEKNNSQWH
jgi:UDP-glucose 6-dehydrogenase